MKSIHLLGAACTLGALFAVSASANCNVAGTPSARAALRAQQSGFSRSSLEPMFSNPPARPADSPLVGEGSIAGYWYVRFVVDGQLVDDGFDIWHSDGTEALNDTSAPSTGNVCLGIWARTAPFTYVLKHPSWIFDDAGVNVAAIAIISERITLATDGRTFSGTSTITVYDLTGNVVQQLSSDVTGERIIATDNPADSTVTSGIPGLPPSILQR